MNKINNKLLTKIAFLCIGGILAFIVLYKAATISFTYDESCTYLFFHKNTTWELFTAPEVWTSVCNHILNTILYKISIGLFGQSDFTLRLPNVIAFVGILIIAYQFSIKLLSSNWARVVLITVLFINPYIIEFYSLCRGYGLSMFFHFSALYFFYNFILSKKTSYLYWGFGMLLFASVSLLTNFLLFPTYIMALWICYIRDKSIRRHVLIAPILFSILTFLLIALPLYYTSGTGEYGYGVGTIWDSFKSLIDRSTSIHKSFGQNILTILTFSFLLGLLVLLTKSFINKRALYFALSICILFFFIHILYYAMGIQFPSERKTTIYIPLLAVFLAVYIDLSFLNLLKRTSIVLISTLLLINFFAYLSLSSTIEWNYDKDTKAHILKLAASPNYMRLQTHWSFNPTCGYYIKTKKIKNIELLPVDRSFKILDETNVILAYKEDMKNIKSYKSAKPEDDIALYYKK